MKLTLKLKMLLLGGLSILFVACQESPARGEYLMLYYEGIVLDVFRGSPPMSLKEPNFDLEFADVLLVGDMCFVAWVDALYYANGAGSGSMKQKGTYKLNVATGGESKPLEPHLLDPPPFEFPPGSVCEEPYLAAVPYAHYRMIFNDPDPWKNPYTLIRSRGQDYVENPPFRLGDIFPAVYEKLFYSSPVIP